MVDNYCVETTAAPEWLSQLEENREKLKQSKLGHEVGAGAPCNECGDKCPGLDLHFWRKVCKICKCRKDQHKCPNEISGWAQFEILGQTRSQPAYIKIKALANQSVQLDWIPPNVTPDVVSEYMEKLGTEKIPVSGSEAANKRKQQLEFQVPPHDLDATLCDNLSESEKLQLLQYVQKIRENCVGQGNVVRIGQTGIGHIINHTNPNEQVNLEYAQVMSTLDETPVTDPVLRDLLSSPKLVNAIVNEAVAPSTKLLIAFTTPISEYPVEHEAELAKLSKATKHKLCGLNKQAICSLVRNGIIYDKILSVIQQKNLDISRDPKLGPISDFRKEYLGNVDFKKEISLICTPESSPVGKCQYTTPIKSKGLHDDAFHSPLPLKNALSARFGAQMKQETPIRKAKFGIIAPLNVQYCGLPSNINYEKDAMFAQIIQSEPLKRAIEMSQGGGLFSEVQLSSPQGINFIVDKLIAEPHLQTVSSYNPVLQSLVLNGAFYDRLFDALKEHGIDYDNCKVLKPMETLRAKMHINKPFHEKVVSYVTQLPNNMEIAYAYPQSSSSINSALKGSNSNDSGFDGSKPSTPQGPHSQILSGVEGNFASIPGIDEMNMYPTVNPPFHEDLSQNMHNLQLAEAMGGDVATSMQNVIMNCRDCSQTINVGDVVVKAERAGKEIAWHPECFKCFTCRELLADLVYFFHGNHIYCGRDLALKLKIPRCKACDELIFTKEYTAAEGATFHIKHFCCYHCDKPLAGKQYIPDDKSNMPLCLKCYDEYFAAVCQSCRLPIGPSNQGVAWGDIHWHSDCFVCAGVNCEKSLIGGRFCVKNNMPFCSPACVRSIIT